MFSQLIRLSTHIKSGGGDDGGGGPISLIFGYFFFNAYIAHLYVFYVIYLFNFILFIYSIAKYAVDSSVGKGKPIAMSENSKLNTFKSVLIILFCSIFPIFGVPGSCYALIGQGQKAFMAIFHFIVYLGIVMIIFLISQFFFLGWAIAPIGVIVWYILNILMGVDALMLNSYLKTRPIGQGEYALSFLSKLCFVFVEKPRYVYSHNPDDAPAKVQKAIMSTSNTAYVETAESQQNFSIPSQVAPQPMEQVSVTPNYVGTARVLHNYVARKPDELTLNVGQTINLIAKDNEGYWKGWMKGESNGVIGYFGPSFVEIVS